MFLYQCNICNFKTNYLTKYNQHCQSSTHLNYKVQFKNQTNNTTNKMLEKKIKVLEDKNKILEDKFKILDKKINILEDKINKFKPSKPPTNNNINIDNKTLNNNINIDNKTLNNKEVLTKNNEKQNLITQYIEDSLEMNNMISDLDSSLENFFQHFQKN